MLRKFYYWIINQSTHPKAAWMLAGISFAESSIFPVPPDPLLIPMALGTREKAWWYAFLCTISSVIGGIVGYLIGYALFETIGLKILHAYGYENSFARLSAEFNNWAFLVISLKALTPIPYKIVTIGCGVSKVNLVTFITASILARGSRFFILSGLCWYYGDPIKNLIEKYLELLAVLFLLFLVGGFLLFKLL